MPPKTTVWYETQGHGHGTVETLIKETDWQLDRDTSNAEGTELSPPSRPPSLQEAGRQVDGDISNADGTELSIPSRSPVRLHGAVDTPPAPNHQKADLQVDGDTSSTDGVELSIPSFSPSPHEADRQVDGDTNADGTELSIPSRSAIRLCGLDTSVLNQEADRQVDVTHPMLMLTLSIVPFPPAPFHAHSVRIS